MESHIDKKFYVPDISEFHIGFEYEWLDDNKVWNKESSPIEITIEGYEEQAYGIRVKYLDKEDIESLGFEHVNAGWYSSKYEFNEDDNPKCWIRDWKGTELSIWKRYYNESESDDIVFRGNVKNKSELKRLLKQLGIDGE